MTDDDKKKKNEWINQSTIQAKESRLAFSAICEQRDWSVWVQAADSIRHKVLDGKDKISWSFIDPCGDIKSVSQEMKGFRQGKLNLTDMTLKLIPLQWHHTIPTNTVLKVASARSSRWPPKGISHSFFFSCKICSVGSELKLLENTTRQSPCGHPAIDSAIFAQLNGGEGAAVQKNKTLFSSSSSVCVCSSGCPGQASLCSGASSVFSLSFSLWVFVPGMARHISVCV